MRIRKREGAGWKRKAKVAQALRGEAQCSCNVGVV